MITHIQSSLNEAREALDSLMANSTALARIETAAQLLLSAFGSGNHVFSCGNGGSMSDAIHFAGELSGRYRLDRKGLPALAMSDVGHLTCVANDFGYDHVFAHFLEAQAASRTGRHSVVREAFNNRVLKRYGFITPSDLV